MLLLRDYYKDRTEGKWIFPDDSYCYNLELPDLDNEPSVSCIPEGEYTVCEDSTGRHQWFRFKEVKGRSSIEMHPVGSVHHLEGCLAPCMKVDGVYAYGCVQALEKFKEWFPEKGICFRVTIREYDETIDGVW